MPAGPLREPVSEIKRADKIILVNKKPFDKDIETSGIKFMNLLKEKFNKPVYLCKFKNGGIYDIKTLEPLNTTKKAYAFTVFDKFPAWIGH